MDARSLIFVAFAAIVPAVHAWDWRTDWRMRGDIYRTFDFTVRGGIDRASKAFDKAVTDEFRGGQSEQDRIASFRAAAAEWRKVQVQSETGDFDEKILSYALFMQGCARERAKDSNEALRLYSEVIELYSDITWVSVPAKLRLGCLQMSMGDVRKGEATLMELLDDPASQKTVARAIAQRIMGDRLWNAGKFDDAIACFREVMGTEIAGESRRNAARDRLVAIALARGDYSNFDELAFFGVQNGDAPRLDAVRRMFDTVCYVWLRNLGWNDFGSRMEKLYPGESARKKKLDASKASFLAWFEGKSSLYASLGRQMDYALDCLRAATLVDKNDVVSARLKAVENAIRAQKDESAASKAAWAAKDILCTVQKYDLARRIPDLVKNPLSSSMMRHQIELSAGKHAAAAMCLEEYLGHKPPPDAAKNAKMTLAQIYRDNLGKYDKAIAIFQELNDPPRTLWELYSTYWKAGKKKEAYSMLVELESMFPPEAPRAFYTHAQRLEEDGNVKQAIAIYRRLLSQPEWKKTAESSWAHQALERHGVATGGAVVNEVR